MTSILYKGMIIEGNAIDGIGAYDRDSGNERWKLLVSGGVEAGAAVKGDHLLFGGSDGRFYSVDINTGVESWVFPVNAEILSAPTIEKDVVYFIAGNNRVYALDVNSGKQLWLYSRRETSTLSIRGGSSPTIAGENVLVGFSDGFIAALNKKDGQVVWTAALNNNHRFRDVDAKPVVDGNQVYVASFDNSLYSINRESGKILWKLEKGGYSAVTLTADKIYFATTQGEMLCLDKGSGKQLWSYKLSSGLATQPKLYRGLLVFGEYEGDLKVLDSQSGAFVGKYSPGRGIMSSPLIDQKTGDLYFISADANLNAMKLTWKKETERWPWLKL